MEKLKFDEIKEDEYTRPPEVWLDLTLREMIQKVDALTIALTNKDEHKAGDILNYLIGYLCGLRDGNRFMKNPYKKLNP